MTALRRLLVPALAVAALGACTTAATDPAQGATPRKVDCPAKRGTVATAPLGRLWHSKGVLYGCTTVDARSPRTVRLGTWVAGKSRVAFDGTEASWTTPLERDGVRSDRLWAGSVETGRRWLAGKLLVPPSGEEPEAEGRIRKLVLADRGVAWATRTGEVGMALADPQSAATAGGGLATPVTPAGRDEKRLLVWRFGAAAVPALAASLALEVLPGEGDECGGVNPYRLAFRTSEAATPFAVTWDGGWTSTRCS